MDQALSILIVEDDAIIAQLIQHHLIQFGYKVVGIIHNGDRALDAIHNLNPDLVLLDINIEGTKDGIDIAKIIESKYDLPYLFITALSDSLTLNRLHKLNPLAYIVKPFKEEDLKVSIALGIVNFKRRAANNSLSIEEINAIADSPLSQKEYEILIEISKGLSNNQIAQQKDLSTNTVKWHTQNIYAKLNVKNRTSAVKMLVDL